MIPERAILGDIVFGTTVGWDIRESLRPIEGNGDIEYTVNGDPVFMGVPEFRQYEYTLSGDGIRPPALARLWPGMSLDPVVPSEELIDYMLVGETSVTLDFDPHPGATKCVGATTGKRLQHQVAGRVVTLSAPAVEDVEVRARGNFRMMCKTRTQDGVTGKSSSWSVTFTNHRRR